MRKNRYGIFVIVLLLCLAQPAAAQVSVSIGLPHVSIGINLPLYPELVQVPGYPVYYAPQVSANYFFYDGYYWVFQDDYWYASNWYNGPWWLVEPDYVPLFILRIPVVYYRQPPQFFFGWHSYEPPRWGQHWGNDWNRRHRDWDRWQRSSTPPPAPRPEYQRKYTGTSYPRGGEQQNLHQRYYRYQPRDSRVREHVQPRVERKGSLPDQRGRRDEPAMRNPGSQQSPRPESSRQSGWPGPQSQPGLQEPQEQRRPSVLEGRQPGAQDREREGDRKSGDYRSHDQGKKAPESRDYERYGRGQGRDKEGEQGSSWDKEKNSGRD